MASHQLELIEEQHHPIIPERPDDKVLRLGELFCGAGGMAFGASQAGYKGWHFEHAWVTDIDRDSCKTIEQVVHPKRIKQQDVKDAKFGDSFYKKIDGLVFGFPCNDFSAVGERRGISGEYGNYTNTA